MNFRILIILIFLVPVNVLLAQKAEDIVRSESRNLSTARDCNNDAGSISLANFIGQSDRYNLSDTVFLCWMDRFMIEHEGDFDLSGDPVPSTAPGVGYAWYNGIPTVTGPDLLSVEADPEAYKPFGEMTVYVDQLNGDALFENGYYSPFTSFNDYINGGNVTQKYFAPITIDSKVGSQALYEGNPAGECVNVRTDEAFTAVYLNPIEVSNIQTHFMGDPTRVQLTLEGGMPEFNNSNFSQIDIQLRNKPSVKGVISGNGFTHGSTLDFTVSEFGLYELIVRDDISCETTFEINIQENEVPLFVLDTITGQVGDIVCVTWTVEDFNGVEYIFGGIKFDPSVVQYTGYNPLDNIFSLDIGSVIGPDQINVQWIAQDSIFDLPDGQEIAEICFEIVGDPGDCTPIYFHYADVVVTDEFGGGDVFPNLEDGMICVDPPNGLHVEVDICGSRQNLDEGTVTFEIFNGTGPYDFVLEDALNVPVYSGTVLAGSGKITLSDIAPGFNYELIVTDALGDMFSVTINIITIDEPLTVVFDKVINPSCYGYSDGTIVIDVFGSLINPLQQGGYNVKWSTGDFGVDSLIQLSNGTYGVTITEDFTGCETESFVNLNVDPLQLDLVVLDTSICAESGGGRVLASVSGGTPENAGYNFDWDDGQFNDIGISSEYNDLSPGFIFVEVWDTFRYCKITDSIEMPFLYELEVDALIQDPFCFGVNDGSMQLLAHLGSYQNPNFTFFPIPNAFPYPDHVSQIGADSLFADSLGAGFYRVLITETGTGCTTFAEYILNGPNSAVTSNINTDPLGCQEGQLGSATIQVQGGSHPYLLTSGSGLPDATIGFTTGTHTYDDLDVGTYYISITDDNGCTLLDTFEIEGSESLLSIDSLVYEPFDCVAGATTDITAYASASDPGTGIFYLWKDESGVIDVDNVLEDIGAGLYYIEVTDSKGCEAIDSIQLFEPELFTVEIIVTDPECASGNGGDLGSICVNTIGGTPGFNYLWTDGTPPDQSCLNNLYQGDYTLEVTDFNNCRVDTIISVGEPLPIDVDILNLEGISCNDGQTFDGQITIAASANNNPTPNFSYELSSGTGGYDQTWTANDLEGGMNWVLVSFNTLSGNTCYADTSFFEITVPEVLEMDYNQLFVQDVNCFGDCDGVAIIGAIGGNSLFYEFDWLDTGSTGPAVADLCAGTYHVQISDANGCLAYDSITINQPDSLNAYIDETNTFGINCFGGNTGQIQIQHEGGNVGSPFTYNWLNSVSDGTLATGLGPGYYSVTVVDSKGCTDETEITLEEQQPLYAEIPTPDPIPCYGGQTCISIDSVEGGAGIGYRFSINGGQLYDLDSCVLVYASDQDYFIEVFDKDGCSYSESIFIDQPNEIVVSLGEDVEVGLGEKAILDAQIIADNTIQVIEWDPLGPLDVCVGTNCQQLEIHPSTDGSYQVKVIDSNGCIGEDEINVFVNSKRNVYIPNVFSPNGDAYNERFKVFTGSGISSVNYFRIYDRWGELIYNVENLIPDINGVGDWDGTYRGKKLSPGVYVYLVEIEFIDLRKIIYRGSVTLLR